MILTQMIDVSYGSRWRRNTSLAMQCAQFPDSEKREKILRESEK